MSELHIGQMLISKSIGGAESIVLDISQKLVEKGIKTSIILNDEISESFKHIDNLNIINIGKVYNNKLFNPYMCNIYIFLYFKLKKRRIIKMLLSQNIKVIHIHLPTSIFLFDELNDELGIKSIFTIHGVSIHHYKNIFDRIIDQIFVNKLKKINFYTSACKYFINKYDQLKLLRNNYIIIPNGINIDNLSDIQEIKLDETYKLLFIGGPRPSKGGDILVKSLDILKRTIPNFKLYMLRNIPETHFIKKYVKKHDLQHNVIFVGYKRPPEYYQYIKNSDVVILPSRTEGIAASLLEALAFGKPIVATNVGGTPELIKHNINGLLTSLDPVDIANSIIYLYRHPDVRKKMSDNNLEYAKQYDWNRIIGDYIQLYNKLVKSNKIDLRARRNNIKN